MKEDYTVPELKVVGEADQVILGLGTYGSDLRGEYAYPGGDFQADADHATER